MNLVVDRKPIRLGNRIGKGGEGEVYKIEGDGSLAVKVYTVKDIGERERKVEAMIRAGLASQMPQVAFPLGVARSPDGRFAGFLMRLVAGHKALHELYPPGSRKHHFPQADYRFLVRSALNISRAIASLHHSGCVIGDINHSSILISRDATVALIDSDSFQVRDGSQLYLCRVGVPEYTPPELQGKSLAGISRTANHDAFGLAIVLFQLLFMGRHPFIGTIRRGELPSLQDAIRDYRFAYTQRADVGMSPPPGAPLLKQFPAAVRDGFEAAFGRKTADCRPTAASWAGNLLELEKDLVQCEAETLHYYPRDSADCPWCTMERMVGTTLFLPFIPPTEVLLHPFDPGAGGFDLASVWAQIESFTRPDMLSLIPPASAPVAPTRSSWKSAHAQRAARTALRIGSALLATTILIAKPFLWIIWLPLYLYSIFWKSDSAVSGELSELKNRYLNNEHRCQILLVAWSKRIGVDEIDRLLASLREAKETYSRLASEEHEQKEKYTRERRARQMEAFLNGFEIRRAKIRGIGPAKHAALFSFGIETAADVEQAKILAVPGFGPTNSVGLLDWRRRMEARFVYNEIWNDVDRQTLNQIRSTIATKASGLRRTLLAGRSNLEALAARVKAMARVRDPELSHVIGLRESLRGQISACGGTVPSVPTLSLPPATHPPQPSVAATRAQTHPRSSPACPRCGGLMIARVARRGANAGNRFWGCAKYPVCNATRPI